jgi:hypothetical protein
MRYEPAIQFPNLSLRWTRYHLAKIELYSTFRAHPNKRNVFWLTEHSGYKTWHGFNDATDARSWIGVVPNEYLLSMLVVVALLILRRNVNGIPQIS